MVLSSFIKKPKSTRYDGEDKDEEILYVLRSSFITNIPWLLFIAGMLIAPAFIDSALVSLIFKGQRLVGTDFIIVLNLFWYVATFGIFFLNFALWFFNVYIITSKKIIDMDFHGLLFKNISEATLDNIEDVTSRVSGTPGVVFNIGDVYVQTAAEQREFEFHGVHDPAKIRDILSDLVSEVRNYHGRGKRRKIILED